MISNLIGQDKNSFFLSHSQNQGKSNHFVEFSLVLINEKFYISTVTHKNSGHFFRFGVFAFLSLIAMG